MRERKEEKKKIVFFFSYIFMFTSLTNACEKINNMEENG